MHKSKERLEVKHLKGNTRDFSVYTVIRLMKYNTDYDDDDDYDDNDHNVYVVVNVVIVVHFTE